MAKVLDCGHPVNEFELQSCYNVHFWIKTLGGKYKAPYLPVYDSQYLKKTTFHLKQLFVKINFQNSSAKFCKNSLLNILVLLSSKS